MFTAYLIITGVVSTTTLIWRNLKMDHPQIKAYVTKLPLIGGALSCGFCSSMWFSLLGVLIVNPIQMWETGATIFTGIPHDVFVLCSGWFTVGLGVLFSRSAVIVLMEASAVLKHMHHENH